MPQDSDTRGGRIGPPSSWLTPKNAGSDRVKKDQKLYILHWLEKWIAIFSDHVYLWIFNYIYKPVWGIWAVIWWLFHNNLLVSIIYTFDRNRQLISCIGKTSYKNCEPEQSFQNWVLGIHNVDGSMNWCFTAKFL